MDDPDLAAAKAELRDELLAARRALTDAEREQARAVIRGHVLAHVDAGVDGDCVAAYVPLRTEPGSAELLAALVARGVRVLVPITRPDHDLDWADWAPTGIGAPLGLTAVGAAGLVLLPALAVARDGTRLGRGGGSYDRALRRVRTGVDTAALLFDDELRTELPGGEWDVPVSAAVTPSGWVAVGGNADFPSRR